MTGSAIRYPTPVGLWRLPDALPFGAIVNFKASAGWWQAADVGGSAARGKTLIAGNDHSGVGCPVTPWRRGGSPYPRSLACCSAYPMGDVLASQAWGLVQEAEALGRSMVCVTEVTHKSGAVPTEMHGTDVPIDEFCSRGSK